MGHQQNPPHKPGRLYEPELDALRFCAFLSVFVYHSTRSNQSNPFYASLSFGMQVFFLLSSYLITKLLLREKESTGTIHFRAFYIRRILRIWPLYFFFLAICSLLGIFSESFYSSPGRVTAFALMVGNWYVGRFGFGRSPIFPLWSISLEEQFYLFWPAIVLLSGRFLLYAAGAILPFSLGCVLLLCHNGASSTRIGTHSGVESLYFAVGTLMALLLNNRPIRKHWVWGACLVACGFLSWPAIQILKNIEQAGGVPLGWTQTLAYAAIAVSGIVILYGFLSIPGALFPRWFTYLGKISYGLYVYHKLCQSEVLHLTGRLHSPLVDGLASLLLTIGCAALSYRFLELPFLKFKERFTFVQSRPN